MKHFMIAVALVGGFFTLVAVTDANAMVCARGVYRAGCVGARGAVVVRHPYYRRAYVRRRVY